MEEQKQTAVDEQDAVETAFTNGIPNGQAAQEAEDRALMEQF